MSAHTPGPWHQDKWGAVRHGENQPVLFGAVTLGSSNSDEIRANDRLIAAAPDLLEAMRDMLSGWRYIRQSHGDLCGVGWDRAQEKAERSIEKATGEPA